MSVVAWRAARQPRMPAAPSSLARSWAVTGPRDLCPPQHAVRASRPRPARHTGAPPRHPPFHTSLLYSRCARRPGASCSFTSCSGSGSAGWIGVGGQPAEWRAGRWRAGRQWQPPAAHIHLHTHLHTHTCTHTHTHTHHHHTITHQTSPRHLGEGGDVGVVCAVRDAQPGVCAQHVCQRQQHL